MAALPTHDGLTCIVAGWTTEKHPDYRSNVEGTYLDRVTSIPGVAERIRQGKREERLRRIVENVSLFRQPYGEGWALVGDAGFTGIRFLPRASRTRFATPKRWPTRLMPASAAGTTAEAGACRLRTKFATTPSCRCTRARCNVARSSRCRPSCGSCSLPCATTRPRPTAFRDRCRHSADGGILLTRKRIAYHRGCSAG